MMCAKGGKVKRAAALGENVSRTITIRLPFAAADALLGEAKADLIAPCQVARRIIIRHYGLDRCGKGGAE